MKKQKIILLAVILLSFFSCKKEEKTTSPEPLPQSSMLLGYNTLDSSAYWITNNDPTTILFGFDGKYSIKYTYQYTLDGITRSAFAYAFAQNDSGTIDFKKYLIIKSKTDFGGCHLYPKFGLTKNFAVYPYDLSDTTLFFTIKNKVNGRTMTVDAWEFESQGFLAVFFD